MGVDLLKHNQEAFQEINKMIESGIKKIAVPRATGSGKTYLMGALAEKYNDDKKLVLEPTRPLLNSIKEKFDEFGITNTDFITYQKLIRMSDEDIAAMDYKLIFLDEAHHGTAPKWGQKINYLMETHSDSIICGTSATTVRNDGVNVIETLFDNNAIGELPLSTAIARKVLPCPHYISTIYRLDDELDKLRKKVENSTNTKAEKKEFYKKMQTMKLHFEKSYGVPLILNKYVKVKNGRYLVFCKDRKHLDTMRDVVIGWFRTAGIKDVHSYAVYSDYPDKEKDYKEFCEDNSDSCKILFSINMLNEGLHIKNISGVLMLRTTQSNLIYLQQLGRLVDADNIDKYLLVFDFVNNFSSVNDGIGLLKEIKDAIAKEKESDPDFNDSEFENIDTFFVLENVVQIQEMFKEIEGRLQGDWDVMFQEYCKFYEKNGHGDVPRTGEYKRLNYWCKTQRRTLKNGEISEDRIKMLERHGFIWDVYQYRFMNNIKALQQYRDREGDCLVPARHIEIVDGKQIKLGNWCGTIRNSKKGIGHTIITPVMEEQLDQMGFVWDVIKYKFVSNVKAVSEYYKEHGKFPLITKKNEEENKLGLFFANEKSAIRKGGYPKWRMEIIKKYLPEFCFETKSKESFNTFLNYLKLYKQEYGHLNIKKEDSINGYNIGSKLNVLNRLFRENKLCEESVKKIEDLGMSLSFKYKWEKQFQENMAFIKQAVEEGVIINRYNQIYRNKNLYTWLKGTFKKRYKSYKVSIGQLKDIERLIGKSLEEFFNNGNHFVKVVDVIENEELGIYNSCVQAIKYIQENFNIDITRSIVDNRLIGKVVSPYKGRFMFYYATKEEIKKYLKDSKVS